MAVGKFATPISSGSAVRPDGSHEVRYFDPFGELIATRYVLTGQNATPPTPPTIPLLTFAHWNHDGVNITRDEDIGAIYDTTDGKTYIFAEFNALTGLQPSIFVNKSTTALMTVDWGDGTTSTSSASGNVTLAKSATYATAGDYTITITCSGGYSIGQGSAATALFSSGNYRQSAKKIYYGSNITSITANSLLNHNSVQYLTLNSNLSGSLKSLAFCAMHKLEAINIPNGLTGNIEYGLFLQSFALKTVIFPKSSTGTFDLDIFNACNSLRSLIISKTATGGIGANSFSANRSNRSITIPIGITSLSASCFQNCTAMEEYIFQSAVPPTMANINVFTNIPFTCKIYVPDANVNDYKTATNWVTYANYIYPISSRP